MTGARQRKVSPKSSSKCITVGLVGKADEHMDGTHVCRYQPRMTAMAHAAAAGLCQPNPKYHSWQVHERYRNRCARQVRTGSLTGIRKHSSTACTSAPRRHASEVGMRGLRRATRRGRQRGPRPSGNQRHALSAHATVGPPRRGIACT